MQKVLVKINLQSLCDNARYFSRLTGVPIYAVVKADAYGHGAVKIAQALSGMVHGFAVSLVEEGLQIKSAACGKEIVVFTPPTNRKEAWLIVKNGLIATVASASSARFIDEVSRQSGLPARVHIKCNTGMNRYGVCLSTLGKACKRLQANDQVRVEGIYSHLYAHDRNIAESQRLAFVQASDVCRRYFPAAKRHLSATYGATLGNDFAFDAVRIGLGLYGYLPDDIEENAPIKKVMSVYAKCVDERVYRFGGAGYSLNSPQRGETMHTMRCGYADGVPYTPDITNAFLKPLSAPCMDACVCVGGKRTWQGKWLPVMTDAKQSAKEAGTICYEVLCRMSARAEKIYGYE